MLLGGFKVKVKKLVRDKIPTIMRLAGLSPEVAIVSSEDRLFWLLKKIQEEISELTETPNVEECADVYEVLIAIAVELGHSKKAVLDTARMKKEEKGGFEEGVILSIPSK